jgi:4-amino-4-deoxy-L-arabinose transferase-like glycosyltransferase
MACKYLCQAGRTASAAVPPICWASLATYSLLGLLAFLPRALDLGVFLTIDEANFWLRRSELFLSALRSGDYGATALSAHPGVTTVWLGGAGLALRRALLEWGLLADTSFPTHLALIRLPLALVHSATILLGYALLRRLLPFGVALLGALLWALDPFLLGYSRLLHTDALAGSFATLSMLALLMAVAEDARSSGDSAAAQGRVCRHRRSLPMLLLSGVFGGLAVLSKLPALALVPAVALTLLLCGFRFRRALRWLLGWMTGLVETVFALWPALWVAPGVALHALREGALIEGGQPHLLGNFFLGQAVDAPGPLFYPVALALRLTPWALVGLLALPFVWKRLPRDSRRVLAALAAFVIIFVLALTIFPKKFNRYLVPAFPALSVLAAAGLVGLVGIVARLAGNGSRRALRLHGLAGATLLLGMALLTLRAAHPYYLTYFNPLLGGAEAGARTFVVGWGEGYEQAAAWLNAQPDITGALTVSAMTPTLQPYLRSGAQAVPPADPLPEQAGYVVISVEQTQRGLVLPPFDQFFGRATPLHTVRIGGLDYLWIYQAPPPVARPIAARFGEALGLRGVEHGALLPGQALELTLFWETYAPPAADYLLFVHLIGPDGQRLTQADLMPGGMARPTSDWERGRYVTTQLALPIPAILRPGQYQVLAGLYDPATAARVPLSAGRSADPALGGPDALLLARFELE